MEITVGRIVLYTLTDQDATEINQRRTTGAIIAERVFLGDVYPMIVTRIWSASCVNGQVFLDGNDCLWATSATEGTGGHQWHWPPRV